MESGFLAGLDEEQRVPYYKWWRKYRILKYTSRVAFGISFILWIRQLRYPGLRHLQGPLLLAAFVLAVWWGLLDCPRCGEQFSSGKIRSYFGDECQSCGLSYLQLSAIGKPRSLQ
jgi:hypothetical protein